MIQGVVYHLSIHSYKLNRVHISPNMHPIECFVNRKDVQMGAFSDRLRMAITNYAYGAITYKGFSELTDIPYRTLQNYLSGERSPNIESLQKLSEHGININWLVTGEGHPYRSAELEKDILDKIFILLLRNVIDTVFNTKKSLFDENEKQRILSFSSENNYLNIGETIRELIDMGELNNWGAAESWMRDPGMDDLLLKTPETKAELWKAMQRVKEAMKTDLSLPPFPTPQEAD